MLNQRTLTALIVAPLAIAVIVFAPTTVLAVIIGALCLQALWEWSRLAGLRSHPLRAGIVAANALLLALLWLIREQPAAWWVVGVGVLGWLAAMVWLRDFSYGAAATRENSALKLIAGEIAIAPAWLALMMLHAGQPNGHGWALFVLMLIWMADTAAYFTGKRFGKTKLAPRISPNKTRAGAYGAFVGGAVLAFVAGWLLQLRGTALVAVVGLGVLTVAASIVGDLFESLLKRQANVKDSGTLFPGHGGLLDRLDSIFAAMPVFVAGKTLLDLIVGP